jgi:hypothetical protein
LLPAPEPMFVQHMRNVLESLAAELARAQG